MAPSTSNDIVIVGAGIIGLNVALALAEKGFGRHITIIAEYMPGDTAPDFTSPWAGCNFSAISGTDENALKWDRAGYSHLMKLASRDPDTSFVKRTPSIEYWDENVPRDKIKFMESYLEDFHVIATEQLPSGVGFGCEFTTLTLNAPKHLLYLSHRLREEYGVTFIRKQIASLDDAYINKSTKLVFVCVGNGAKTLPGVMDSKCFHTRGQVVLAKAESVDTNIMRHGTGYETYVIPRPFSKGHVILGGYMQKGNNDPATYSHESEDILERTTKLHSQLRENGFDAIAAFAGMRPSREGGARLARDSILVGELSKPLVYNYGAGGTGYQAGFGMALDSVALADDVLMEIKHNYRASRL